MDGKRQISRRYWMNRKMNNKQIRMLQLLDEQILSCTDCELCKNGRAKPFWSLQSEYLIIGEAPGEEEVINDTPFIGRAGRILWNIMNVYGLYREQFGIINSVNCRPVAGGKNGKPAYEQTLKCNKWIRKYVHALNPKKILLLGSYAIKIMTNRDGGITANNAMEEIVHVNGKRYITIKSVHPAYTIYSGSDMLLRESISKFKER
jgi:uracil-DNA glycosylase